MASNKDLRIGWVVLDKVSLASELPTPESTAMLDHSPAAHWSTWGRCSQLQCITAGSFNHLTAFELDAFILAVVEIDRVSRWIWWISIVEAAVTWCHPPTISAAIHARAVVKRTIRSFRDVKDDGKYESGGADLEQCDRGDACLASRVLMKSRRGARSSAKRILMRLKASNLRDRWPSQHGSHVQRVATVAVEHFPCQATPRTAFQRMRYYKQQSSTPGFY
ncbi:hypothetical protein V8C35DRAFT_49911 [Trichoderma chlorosporum]